MKEDVPRLVSSQNVDSVEKIVSAVFKSLPSNLNKFIKWVAEVRITEDTNQNLSAEEKSRLKLKVFSGRVFNLKVTIFFWVEKRKGYQNPKLH